MRNVSQCSEEADKQYPEESEPDGRIHWRIRCEMDLAQRLGLAILEASPGKVWGKRELIDAIYSSSAWDHYSSASIGLGLRQAEKRGLIEVSRDGTIFQP